MFRNIFTFVVISTLSFSPLVGDSFRNNQLAPWYESSIIEQSIITKLEKLKEKGLSDEQSIAACADEIAASSDGEHDEKSFFTSKLTLIVGGVLVTGLAAYGLYWLCKSTQNTGSTVGEGSQDIFSFAPGYQASPAERIAIDQLQQNLISNRQNPSELTRLTDEFRQAYPVSETGHITYDMSWSEPFEMRDSDGNIIATGSRSYTRLQEF